MKVPVRVLASRQRTWTLVASLGAVLSTAYIVAPVAASGALLGATEALSRLMSTVSVLSPVAAGMGSFAAIRPSRVGYHHLLDGAARPRWQVLASQLSPVIAFVTICYLAAAVASLSAYGLAGAPGRFEWVAAAQPLSVVWAMSVAGFAAGIAARAVVAPWLLTIAPFVVTVLTFVVMAALAERGTDRDYLISGFNAVSMEFWQDFSWRYLAAQAAMFAAAALLLACLLSMDVSARSVPTVAAAAVSASALMVSIAGAGVAGPMLQPAAAAVMDCAGSPVRVCAWAEDARSLDEFAARSNRIYAATPADLRPTKVLQWGLPGALGETRTGRFRSVPDDPTIANAVATDQPFLAHGCTEAPAVPPQDPLRPILVTLRAAGAEPAAPPGALTGSASQPPSTGSATDGVLTRTQRQTLREQIDRLCRTA